jgi:hypothetical protein
MDWCICRIHHAGTRPATAIICSPGFPPSFAPRDTPGAADTLPATLVSYAVVEGSGTLSAPVTSTVPGVTSPVTGIYSVMLLLPVS